jgi:hypothetical protein
MSNSESISKTFAQRHYLEYSDSRISENMEWLRKDAALKWELDQISQTGPNWREHIAAAEQAASAGGGEAMGGGIGGAESALGGAGGASPIPETTPTGGTEAAPEGGAPAAETGGAPPAAPQAGAPV